MSELKSLDEIKLEIDLIMVDIEVLGEKDKDEAVKYLENSLEELKIVSNWELQNTHDSQENNEGNSASKRIKLETTKMDEEGESKVLMDTPEDSGKIEQFYPESNSPSEGNTDALVEDLYPPMNQEVYNHENAEPVNTNDKLLEESTMGENFEQSYAYTSMANNVKSSEYDEHTSEQMPAAAMKQNNVETSVYNAPAAKPVAAPVLYNGKIPTCTECNASFPSLGTLDTHVKTAHKQNGGKDNGRIGRRAPVVRNPAVIQGSSNDMPETQADMDGKFPCSYCEYKGTNRYNLKVHVNRHTGKYRCDVCDVNLSRQQSFDNHMKTSDHLKKVNQIDWSGAPEPQEYQSTEFNTFNQSPLMEPTRPDQDDVIGQLFSESVSVDGQDFSMDSLLDSSSNKNEEYELNFPVNPEPVTVSQSSLNEYMNQQLLKSKPASPPNYVNPQKGFNCEQCGNTYSKSDSLKRHMITHSGRFKCPTCEYGFTEQGRLNSHLRNKDNCNKLSQMRGKTSEARREPFKQQAVESYLNPGDWAGDTFESRTSPVDFPPGIQITRKSQPIAQNNVSNGFGNFLNPILAEKFLSNPNLSIQVKSESRSLY